MCSLIAVFPLHISTSLMIEQKLVSNRFLKNIYILEVYIKNTTQSPWTEMTNPLPEVVL